MLWKFKKSQSFWQKMEAFLRMCCETGPITTSMIFFLMCLCRRHRILIFSIVFTQRWCKQFAIYISILCLPQNVLLHLSANGFFWLYCWLMASSKLEIVQPLFLISWRNSFLNLLFPFWLNSHLRETDSSFSLAWIFLISYKTNANISKIGICWNLLAI